jgi:hypothetical protein
MLPSIWWPGSPRGLSLYRESAALRRLEALGVLPYMERKRKSILRRVQVEEGFGLGFLSAGRSEKALHEECSLKKALA